MITVLSWVRSFYIHIKSYLLSFFLIYVNCIWFSWLHRRVLLCSTLIGFFLIFGALLYGNVHVALSKYNVSLSEEFLYPFNSYTNFLNAEFWEISTRSIREKESERGVAAAIWWWCFVVVVLLVALFGGGAEICWCCSSFLDLLEIGIGTPQKFDLWI